MLYFASSLLTAPQANAKSRVENLAGAGTLEVFLFGFLSALAVIGFAVFRLVPIDRREALKQLLFGQFLKPLTGEVVVAEAPPPPAPSRPPARYGNILPIEAENDPSDSPDVFDFPETYEASLPYEDFNRRLIILDLGLGNSSPFPLYPTRISDEPIRISGSQEYLRRLIKEQFRPAYAVLLDTTGLFAATSARLEWDPLFVSPITQVFLAIPEANRPVVISVTNAAQQNLKQQLTFIRYGFEDYQFDTKFLSDRGRLNTMSLAILFDRFLGPPDKWMWFSRARLQYEIVSRDRESAALAQKLKEDAEREHREAQRLNDKREQDDSYETFAELFGIANPASGAAA